jgi:hypothetical protein
MLLKKRFGVLYAAQEAIWRGVCYSRRSRVWIVVGRLFIRPKVTRSVHTFFCCFLQQSSVKIQKNIYKPEKSCLQILNYCITLRVCYMSFRVFLMWVNVGGKQLLFAVKCCCNWLNLEIKVKADNLLW